MQTSGILLMLKKTDWTGPHPVPKHLWTWKLKFSSSLRHGLDWISRSSLYLAREIDWIEQFIPQGNIICAISMVYFITSHTDRSHDGKSLHWPPCSPTNPFLKGNFMSTVRLVHCWTLLLRNILTHLTHHFHGGKLISGLIKINGLDNII